MSAPLSPKQAEIYDYILRFTKAHGYPPSVREISTAVNLKSPSTVHFHMKKLEAEVKLKESQGQLASIKADIAEGRYIETAAATEQLAEFMDTFKNFAMNIPSRVAGTVASYTDAATARAIERATRKELEDMLALFVDAAVVEPEEAKR